MRINFGMILVASFFLILVFIAFTSLPILLNNFARLDIVITHICNVDNLLCTPSIVSNLFTRHRNIPKVFENDQIYRLKRAESLLNVSNKLRATQNSRFYEHHAIVVFALGDHDRAAKMMSLANSKDSQLLYWNNRFSDSNLLKAYQSFYKEDWSESVKNFQSSLIGGAGGLLEKDYEVFYTALYRLYLEHSQERNIDQGYYSYQAGKYAQKLGVLDHAKKLLTNSIKNEKYMLDKDSFADAYYRLGMIELEKSQPRALENFYKALSLNPHDLRSYLEIQRLNIEEQEKSLHLSNINIELPNEPTVFILERYQSGVRGDQQKPKPYLFKNGWELVGYDLLDVNALEIGAKIPIALWWQSEIWSYENFQCFDTGKYCIQIVKVPNLIPNGGFEWISSGNLLDEKILGYPFSWYDTGFRKRTSPYTNSIEEIVSGNGEETSNKVLSLNVTDRMMISQVRSYPIPTDIEVKYLFSTLIDSKDGGNPAFGCIWVGVDNLITAGQQYGYVTAVALDVDWTTYASILSPVYGSTACQPAFFNIQEMGSVKFDNAIFIPVYSPELR